MPSDNEPSSFTERFDLMQFTNDLIGDLRDLRAGTISNRDAQARALLAKQVLRSIHYVVQAQKFLSDQAKQIEVAK